MLIYLSGKNNFKPLATEAHRAAGAEAYKTSANLDFASRISDLRPLGISGPPGQAREFNESGFTWSAHDTRVLYIYPARCLARMPLDLSGHLVPHVSAAIELAERAW